MGISASIGLIPVCSGSFTGCRSTMPGATMSICRRPPVELMGPLPSIGSPSGSTTRPRYSGPTGMSSTRPVRRTGSPSCSSVQSPSTTAPMLSSSRFSASAVITSPVSAVISSISLDIACESP